MEMVECWVYRVLANDRKEFLLLKRSKEQGAFWQPVCGQMEVGERVWDTVTRELQEETSIRPNNILKRHEEFYKFTITTDYLTGEPLASPIIEHVVGVAVDQNVNTLIEGNGEHTDFTWLPATDVAEYLFWKDNKTAFATFLEQF